MGMRFSAMICQRVTNSVRHIVNKHNVDVVNYLDDFGGADKAYSSYECLLNVIQNYGLEVAAGKCCAPSTSMIFLRHLSQYN